MLVVGRFVLEESNLPVLMHVDTRDNTGRSALMKACESGHLNIVEYMVSRGANVSVQVLYSHRRYTILSLLPYPWDMESISICPNYLHRRYRGQIT